ncbi:MAG: hypothetical protein NTW08_03690 [Gammaproteobacteria bacterium]|nr:hypothetical protein [Gammaproteobacteria bacterium]
MMFKMFDNKPATVTNYCYSDDRQHDVYVETNKETKSFKAVVIDVPSFSMPENVKDASIQVNYTDTQKHDRNGVPIKKLEISLICSNDVTIAQRQVSSFSVLLRHLNEIRHLTNLNLDRTYFLNEALVTFSRVITGEAVLSPKKDGASDVRGGANLAF